MPARRLSMRRIREVLRLKFELGLENRQIARSCRISHSSVGNYLIRARRAGLSWPLPPDLDDEALRQRLFPPDEQPAETSRPLPDGSSLEEGGEFPVQAIEEQ
jgi:hypothetical protein